MQHDRRTEHRIASHNDEKAPFRSQHFPSENPCGPFGRAVAFADVNAVQYGKPLLPVGIRSCGAQDEGHRRKMERIGMRKAVRTGAWLPQGTCDRRPSSLNSSIMKFKAVPENMLERIALRLDPAPMPLVDTQAAYTTARAVMAASNTGVFEALGKERLSARTGRKPNMLFYLGPHAYPPFTRQGPGQGDADREGDHPARPS